MRGFRGRCPRCGEGRLLAGYIAPVAECAVCGEHLAPYLSGDLGPYFVTFAIGLTFTPVLVNLSMSGNVREGLVLVVAAVAVACALILLPRAKGAAIGALWALDIQANRH